VPAGIAGISNSSGTTPGLGKVVAYNWFMRLGT
jgi:hypothetical protein